MKFFGLSSKHVLDIVQNTAGNYLLQSATFYLYPCTEVKLAILQTAFVMTFQMQWPPDHRLSQHWWPFAAIFLRNSMTTTITFFTSIINQTASWTIVSTVQSCIEGNKTIRTEIVTRRHGLDLYFYCCVRQMEGINYELRDICTAGRSKTLLYLQRRKQFKLVHSP